MTGQQQPERRAVAFAARRLVRVGCAPWTGYAACPACPWWTVTPDADSAVAAADAHRCPLEKVPPAG